MTDKLLEAGLEYIRAVMAQTNTDPSGLARRAGLSTTTLTRPLNTPNYPHAFSNRTIQKIFDATGIEPPRALGLFVAAAERLQEPEAPLAELSAPRQTTLPGFDQLPKDVPVMGVAAGSDDGAFNFDDGVIDRVRRPPGIANARDVYALYVINESMVPAFRPGGLIYVSAKRPPQIGDDVVIRLKAKVKGDPEQCFLKRLVRRTAKMVKVEQFNPPKPVEYEMDRIIALHRVLTLEDLLGI